MQQKGFGTLQECLTLCDRSACVQINLHKARVKQGRRHRGGRGGHGCPTFYFEHGPRPMTKNLEHAYSQGLPCWYFLYDETLKVDGESILNPLWHCLWLDVGMWSSLLVSYSQICLPRMCLAMQD